VLGGLHARPALDDDGGDHDARPADDLEGRRALRQQDGRQRDADHRLEGRDDRRRGAPRIRMPMIQAMVGMPAPMIPAKTTGARAAVESSGCPSAPAWPITTDTTR
jgi:hypothetical protein